MWRRLLIGLLVLASVAATVVTATLYLLMIGDEQHYGPSESAASLLIMSMDALSGLGWTAAGWVLAAQRPRNALGWLFLACGLMISGAHLFGYLGFAAVLGVPTVVLALYPDGRLPARWWRLPFGMAIAGVTLQCGLPMVVPGFGYDRWAFGDDAIGMFLIAPSAATILIATIVRWWRAEYPYRQQLAWFLGCGVLSYGCYFGVPFWYGYDFGNGVAAFWALTNPMLIMPIGVAVGVLRYGLLGVKAVLRRGLVYAALTLPVFIVYLGVTAVLATMLDKRPLPGVVAAAIVAVGLAPVRNRLQRAADRLVYGARRDPLQALTELSDRVADDHLDVVPAAVATVAAAVRADGAMIVAPDGEVLARSGWIPTAPDRYLALPLRFGGADIGELRVAEPSDGGHYSDAEFRLLAALAAQLAVVVSATELAEDLEAERNRVITATRDERDRLRRDLHDGLGPSLTGMSLGLQALGGLVGDDDGPAGTLVRRIRSETDNAVRDIRRIIDGLRPTVLDTVNLTRAVERHADTLDATLPVDVTAESLPTLAPDVEVAAYRIITEALTNVARHADARHAQVTISADEELHIAVSDDGHGIHAAGAGVGLSSMRRRAEALGGGLAIHSGDGGTTVTATLPLSPARSF